jgi:hypothetical protein
MKSVFLSFFLLIGLQAAFAQSDPASLLLQSPDGKTVKLLWFVQTWSPEITAFDIKRRDGMADWAKLNAEPIVPGISTKKKLAIVESDKSEESRVRDRLFDMLKDKRLRETDNTYLQKLATDENYLKEITKAMGKDYDVALLNGFAYVDHTATAKASYQYGLFAAGTNKLLATGSWNYGEIPDLDVITEITSKAQVGKKGIQLTWNADINKMRANDVSGFNIYRQGIRLNEVPIIAANNKDLTEFTWYDKGAPTTELSQYSISAESIFGIEGRIRSYNYDPADHPKEYKKADVTEVASMGYYFKEGINIQWSFPKEQERFIKGFYVEKDNMPEGYNQVSRLLSPGTRTFIDNTASPVSSYIRFRVSVVYSDRTNAPGSDRVYSYFPVREPPTPLNIRAKGAYEDKKYTIQLTWDTPMKGDSITSGYRVYLVDPMYSKLNLVADNLPSKPGYKYVHHGTAATYRFCVSALGKLKSESTIDDTVSVWAPSTDLPTPTINTVALEENNAAIQWQYPDVTDLKGFRLFRNQEVIATENELKKDMRKFTASKLDNGAVYGFTIRAVSESGVLSDASAPIEVNVPKKK